MTVMIIMTAVVVIVIVIIVVALVVVVVVTVVGVRIVVALQGPRGTQQKAPEGPSRGPHKARAKVPIIP